MVYAVIFPGQGAARPGAGEAWRDHPSWQLVDRAEAVTGEPLARLLLDADAAELATTRSSQLAVLLTSLLGWDALVAALPGHPTPCAFSGHSLGQVTALIAAGAVDWDEGIQLAVERADLSQRSADANPGKMAALVGATVDIAEKACVDVDAWVANDNAPGQVVIAGTHGGLNAAGARAKELGARRVMPLDVGHAFHTPLLADVADGLHGRLATTRFREPTAPVVANTDGLAHADPTIWSEQLARHLTEPVLWLDCQRTLESLGATTFVEIGPGKVLAGIAKRSVPDVRVLNLFTPDDASAVASELASLSPAPAGAPAAPAPAGTPAHGADPQEPT